MRQYGSMQETITPNYINLEYFFYKIYLFLSALWQFITRPEVLAVLKFFAQLLIVVAFALIFYWIIRLDEIKRARYAGLQKVVRPDDTIDTRDPRLKEISRHLISDSPSDWKLAIIEADVLLDELVARIIPEGNNLGERLKMINRSSYPWLDDAWEAHIVRNRIAHEGSQFTLSRTEARRIVGLYEKVFEATGFTAQ